RALGATAVVGTDAKALAALKASFDFILSTVPQSHDLNPFIPLLRRDRAIVVVGALDALKPVANMQVAAQRRSVSASLIGSIAETQEVLDFCAEHAIAPDIQVIPISEINDAYAHVVKGDVRFRYVIDIATLRSE
ncbi:MAG: zinc-binding dehydrogenase, partial [Janthinobacterium lividum]